MSPQPTSYLTPLSRKRSPGENQVKSFYFLYYAAAAGFLPFLALFYEQRGMSGRLIGVLTSVSPIIALFASSMWSGLADATRSHRKILILTVCGTILSAFGIFLGNNFFALMIAVVIFSLFNSPIMPLVDSTAMRILKGEEHRYGKLRFWGAVGWGISAPLIGLLVDSYGLNWPFYSFAFILFIGLLSILKLPSGGSAPLQNYRKGFTELMRNSQWVLFLVIIFITGIGLSTIHNYLFLYMNQLNFSPVLMGLALTVATVSEMLIYHYSDRMLVRWGIRKMLIIAVVSLIIRLIAYSCVSTAWAVLAIQLFHGLSFSVLLVAGVAFANESAPTGLESTAQGILSGVSMGLSAAVGALAGGWMYESLGASLMYRWTGIIVLALIIMTLLIWSGVRRIRKLQL